MSLFSNIFGTQMLEWWNKYFCLNVLFWPRFEGAINYKYHDFDVNKSERDDYGHY